MAVVRPFRALRPTRELAEQVAAPPYDVLSTAEARALSKGNHQCFLRISRAELELDEGIDPYTVEVYQRGADNLQKLIDEGVLYREAAPIFGVYRQRMGDHVQAGLVALASVDEYDRDLIKKHELTRPDKEADRVKLIDTHKSQSGPVFLTYRQTAELADWFAEVMATEPEVDFTASDGIGHTVWAVRNSEMIDRAVKAFGVLPALYVADGHHRSAAASRVFAERRESGRLEGGEDGFLTVIFPHDEMQILSYNRVVRDLNGLTPSSFLGAIAESFDVTLCDAPGYPPEGGFDVYVGGEWSQATPKREIVPENDPVGSLAVSLLANNVLSPVLGIHDQRTNKRIDFVGGIRGIAELERRVDSGEWAAGIWLFPTTVNELMAVADAGLIMPPKSTWFEPKLRDGLFINMFG